MKLLTCTALFLLLISLASVSYGQDVGTINYPNGGIYVGEVRNDQPNGQGTYTFASGSIYVGEFRDGQRNGQGTFTWGPGDFEGDVYVGEFRDGNRHGQGTFTWADGDVYVGEYRNDQRNGQGLVLSRFSNLRRMPSASPRRIDRESSP